MKIDVNNIYRLKGAVQHYAWGGHTYIPQLLGIENAANKPFAEYWMGTHNAAPSLLLDGGPGIELNKVLQVQPGLLGEETYRKFGQLPYLFKVLDVKEMLSIQVHPTKEEAEKGFLQEEERGIAVNAPNRNYKDSNHKPEVMIALSDFWLLHGFKAPDILKQTLNTVPELRSLAPIFENEGYHGLFQHVMQLPQPEADAMLLPLVHKEVRRRTFQESEKHEAGYWVGEYYLNKKPANIDKGVFAIYFLNLVHLAPGEAIFQAAGVPHAYLQGQNIELMANSDNVLRGGLTNKHIDVDELMKLTAFNAVTPEILTGEKTGAETFFRFPVDDFAIGSISIEKGQDFKTTARSAEIIICIEGSCTIAAKNTLELSKGDVCIAFAGNEYTINTAGYARLFRATIG